MRILLIQPKMNKREMDSDFKTKMSPSLALLTLMNLTEDIHEVIMVNENVEKLDSNINVDLVALTITLDVLNRGAEIAKSFMDRGIPVIAGGIHISSTPETCQEYFTSICIGPAERVWKNIVEDCIEGKFKSVYKDFDGFLGREIVSPKYDFNGKEKYLYTNVVTTSRGCQNKCTFCYNSSKNSIYIKRPIEDVISDINKINKKHIYFIDDNFVSDIEYAYLLIEEIRKMNITWGCAVETNIYNHLDLMDKMVEAGCQSLFIGFESINPKALVGVNKLNKVEEYEKLINEIHNRGLMLNASMVFGLDGDRVSVFEESIDWLIKMKVETLTSHILTPYPGTVLYEKMWKENRLKDFNLSNYNTANVVFEPELMTAKELKSGYLGVYKEFYSFKNIYKRMPINKKQKVSYLLFNIFYRRYGYIVSKISKILPMRTLGNLAEKIAYSK